MEPGRPEKEFRVDQGGLYWVLWSMLSSRAFLCLLRTLWVVANNLYCLPAYFCVMGMCTPILLVKPSWYWKLEEIFFDWLLSMVACWSYTAGYKVVESGDDLEAVAASGASFMFMPNHQSTADVPLCMTLFVARRNFTARVMWIMDKIFKYTNFGWVAWMHDDFFILAGKEFRERSLLELRAHLKEVFKPKNRRCLVLFPEGGFLRKRKHVSQAFAKKNDLRHLENVTLPRTGALEVILQDLAPSHKSRAEKAAKLLANGGSDAAAVSSLDEGDAANKEITKVVDVTIAYPDGRPLDLLTIAIGYRRPCTTHVHYRVFDIKDIPPEPEKMREWMYNLYYEKDEMLAKYYQTGVFPYDFHKNDDSSRPRELMHDPIRFLLLHVFFVALSLGTWKFLIAAKAFLAQALFI